MVLVKPIELEHKKCFRTIKANAYLSSKRRAVNRVRGNKSYMIGGSKLGAQLSSVCPASAAIAGHSGVHIRSDQAIKVCL